MTAPPASAAPAPSVAPGPLFAEELTERNFGAFWEILLARISDSVLQMMLRGASRAWLVGVGDARVEFKAELHDSCKSYAEQNAAKLELACRDVLGRSVAFRYERGVGAPPGPTVESPAQLAREAERDPFVRKALEVFGAKLLDVQRVRRKLAEPKPETEDEPPSDAGLADAEVEATEDS